MHVLITGLHFMSSLCHIQRSSIVTMCQVFGAAAQMLRYVYCTIIIIFIVKQGTKDANLISCIFSLYVEVRQN